MSDYDYLQEKVDKLEGSTSVESSPPLQPARLAEVERERHVYNRTTKL